MCVCECDSDGVGVIVCVRKGVWEWDSLDCCLKVIVCVSGGSACGCDFVGEDECVGGTALIAAVKYVNLGGGRGGGGVCVDATVWV